MQGIHKHAPVLFLILLHHTAILNTIPAVLPGQYTYIVELLLFFYLSFRKFCQLVHSQLYGPPSEFSSIILSRAPTWKVNCHDTSELYKLLSVWAELGWALSLMLSTLPRWFQCPPSAVKMTETSVFALTSTVLMVPYVLHGCLTGHFHHPRSSFFASFMTSCLKPEARLILSMWSETRHPSTKPAVVTGSENTELI